MSHLFIKKITIQKDLKDDGNWFIGVVDTNRGKFDFGQKANAQIGQEQIDTFIKHIKAVFIPELEKFLEREEKEKK